MAKANRRLLLETTGDSLTHAVVHSRNHIITHPHIHTLTLTLSSTPIHSRIHHLLTYPHTHPTYLTSSST